MARKMVGTQEKEVVEEEDTSDGFECCRLNLRKTRNRLKENCVNYKTLLTQITRMSTRYKVEIRILMKKGRKENV